jgi:hypothetical protein
MHTSRKCNHTQLISELAQACLYRSVSHVNAACMPEVPHCAVHARACCSDYVLDTLLCTGSISTTHVLD